MTAQLLRELIRTVPDFPKPGILFYDIATLTQDKAGFAAALDLMAEQVKSGVDYVAGIESRGFIFGATLAARLGVGFVMLRKKGKLPGETISVAYGLEYAESELEISREASCVAGHKVLIVDDVLATGGSADAARQLVEKVGGQIAGMLFLIELVGLGGRERLSKTDVITVLALSA